MKPSIIHIVQHLKPGGIENFALEFQRAASPFFDVHVISLEKSSLHYSKRNYGKFYDFIHVLDKEPGWQVEIIWKLIKIIKEIKPLYVHTHHIGPLIYGGLAARLSSAGKVIHTEHDAWHLTSFKRRTLQHIFLKLVAPIVVADANFVASQVRKLLPSIKPIVIANGIDENRFKPEKVDKNTLLERANLPTHLTFIGCAARLEPVKSHNILIRALAKLPPNIGLLLAGTGSLLLTLKKLVKELKLEERVFFLGHIQDMSSFYPLLDVFCLSSSNEGLPLSPLEAQACNIPVVLTNVGGCSEAICEYTGKLVKPNNPTDLSQALLHTLREKTTISPRVFIKKERSINSMIRQYISLTQADLRGKL